MGRKRKYTLNENIFENPDNFTIQVRNFLGFIGADGYVCEKGGRLEIKLKDTDIEILEKFRNLLETNRPIRHREYLYKGKILKAATLEINSKKIVRDLIKLGVTQHKSETFKISDKINTLDSQRDVLAGYFDGDGSLFCRITEDGRQDWGLSFICSDAHADQIIELVSKVIGCKRGGVNDNFLKNKEKTITEFRMHGNISVYKFMKWLNGASDHSARLDRKLQKYQDFLNYYEPIVQKRLAKKNDNSSTHN